MTNIRLFQDGVTVTDSKPDVRPTSKDLPRSIPTIIVYNQFQVGINKAARELLSITENYIPELNFVKYAITANNSGKQLWIYRTDSSPFYIYNSIVSGHRAATFGRLLVELGLPQNVRIIMGYEKDRLYTHILTQE